MMRVAFGERRLKVVGTGGTLREGSASLGWLVVELAKKLRAEEPVEAVT
jgi:hypothetical protein